MLGSARRLHHQRETTRMSEMTAAELRLEGDTIKVYMKIEGRGEDRWIEVHTPNPETWVVVTPGVPAEEAEQAQFMARFSATANAWVFAELRERLAAERRRPH
jgi:hypothetical protein